MAGGTEKPESDVDLVILGTISLREVSGLLSGAGQDFGREINTHVMTPREFLRRRAAGDHFVHTVMGGPRVFLVGNERELEELG
jgi:hypothetical protein